MGEENETGNAIAVRHRGTSCSARNPWKNTSWMARLIRTFRLPVGGLGLLTVGFRITDRPKEKWTRRFNRFKYGEPAAIRAATRTFCAAFEDFVDLPGTLASSSSPRSLQVKILCNTDTPASILASALAAIPRLGVASASRYQGPASPNHQHPLRGRAGRHRGRGVPCLPPSEASPAW